jgi:hypothetical protein
MNRTNTLERLLIGLPLSLFFNTPAFWADLQVRKKKKGYEHDTSAYPRNFLQP